MSLTDFSKKSVERKKTMIKELATTITLAVSIGAQPLKTIPIDPLEVNWVHITGDGMISTLQILVNDGREHAIATSNNAMAFDEICYYVANWYDNYVNNYPNNVDENTRLFGFIYNRNLVVTEYVTAFASNLFNGQLYSYYGNEQHNMLTTSGLTYTNYYDYRNFNTSGVWNINDDGDYVYLNYYDTKDYQTHVFYVRGNDKFFRTDVITSIYFNADDDWDGAHLYFYHDNNYQLGFNQGYSNGYTGGRVEAFDNGYTSGYNDGIEAASTTSENGVFSLITGAFASVSAFLSFQIAPNITLGLLFSVPIVVGIIFVIIKFVKG